MKTESYKWWEEVQSKLHQNFDNVRLSATHILWLSENFPPTKCEQAHVIKSGYCICANPKINSDEGGFLYCDNCGEDVKQ